MSQMLHIFYGGQEYSGAFCPNYVETTDLYLQATEFGKIIKSTLLRNSEYVGLNQEDIDFFKIDAFSNQSEKERIFKLTISPKISEKEIILIPQSLYFPSIEEICDWNEQAQTIFEEEGIYGVSGLKDKNIIDTMIKDITLNSLMFGYHRYPTVICKAARIWHEIARYQAFNNGNKRTAFITTTRFLQNNFLDFDSRLFKKKMEKELYDVSLKIATEEFKEDDIRKYINNHLVVNFAKMKLFVQIMSKSRKV